VYPLPWQDVTVSAAFQSLNGYLAGTAAQAYGGFTAGTGFDRPNGLGTYYQIASTTRYQAGCPGPCRPGELVVPNFRGGAASLSLVAPETEYTPRINQLDLSASKRFAFGNLSVLPKVDIFNALNSDDYTSVETVQFGARTYMQPSVVLQGRIIRIGADVRW
jgi:hypothetical protein